MFQLYDRATDSQQRDTAELTREDLLLAIETAKEEGFFASEKALIELLKLLDRVLGVRRKFRYRKSFGARTK